MVWSCDDELASHDDGVLARLGRSAVAADAAHDDVDRGRAGQRGTGNDGHLACSEVRIVQGDGQIRSAEALVEMVGQHGLGSIDGLLAGLADEHQGAVPLALDAQPYCGRRRSWW